MDKKVVLHKAEKPWMAQRKNKKIADSAEAQTQELYCKFQAILNKLTPQKFQTLAEQALRLEINTKDRLSGCIDKIFTKAVEEPSFTIAYANLCKVMGHIKVEYLSENGQTKQTNFRKMLLSKCQKEFEKGSMNTMQEELESAEMNDKGAAKRYLGNIRFIGELYKLQMLGDSVMHECITRLLKSTSDEESLECSARLITTVGKVLDSKEAAKGRIDAHFKRINYIIEKGKVPARVRFMLQDVIELRKNSWIPRVRQDQQLKTIIQMQNQPHEVIVHHYRPEDMNKAYIDEQLSQTESSTEDKDDVSFESEPETATPVPKMQAEKNKGSNDKEVGLQQQERQLIIRAQQAANLQRQIAQLEKRVQESDKRAEESTRRAEELQRQVLQSRKQLARLDRRVQESDKRAEESTRRAEELQIQMLRSSKQVAQLNRRVNESDRRAKEADGRAEEAERRVEELQEQVALSDGRAEQFRRNVQDLERSMAEVRCTLRENEDRLLAYNTQWVVRREEIELSGPELGRGGWATVTVAKFRGMQVAVKRIHNQIISPHNAELFRREMNMASSLRHPNLVQFIGATVEGDMMIVMELMATNLRAQLQRDGYFSLSMTKSVSLDISKALNYLHQIQPNPIVHRDISSANILLEESARPKLWNAKLTDYGTVNLVCQLSTQNPGSPAYAAPEANNPHLQSPKMDIYSYGALVLEMLTGRLPAPDHRTGLLCRVYNEQLLDLIRSCLSENTADRPTAEAIISLLSQL